jgi:hypothetical protein
MVLGLPDLVDSGHKRSFGKGVRDRFGLVLDELDFSPEDTNHMLCS